MNNNQNISLKDIENKDVMIRTNKCKNDKIINGSVYNNCKNHNNNYKNILLKENLDELLNHVKRFDNKLENMNIEINKKRLQINLDRKK